MDQIMTIPYNGDKKHTKNTSMHNYIIPTPLHLYL